MDAVERGDELHFGRAGVHEAGVDSGLKQGSEEAFGAEHACSIMRAQAERGCGIIDLDC
ncbi:MAG TPA: hypothetical protein VMH80_28665 [Bryobacteraceae bacterium]|nr:hypothetical protein [Bryobacteraceae bacterium]